MSKKKYDTNPLDHDVKRAADEKLAATDSSGAASSPEEDSTRALPLPPSPRSTQAQGLNNPTQIAGPMTGAELPAAPTGPAYMPPAPSPALPPPPRDVSPGYQNSRPQYGAPYAPNYPPAYQPNPQMNYQGNYQGGPGAYPPASYPGGPVNVGNRPIYPSQVKRGIGLDPNIEGGLCYVPWIGWIMSIIVLTQEPKTNVFARYHAMQGLAFHIGKLVLSITMGLIVGLGYAIGGHWLSDSLGALKSLIDWLLLGGMIFLLITAFQMKVVKIPYISEMIEKYTTPEVPRPR